MRYGSKLLDVLRPGRYEGLEAGAVVKDWDATSLHVALAFPDTYEIGTSHLGIQILYEILNDLDYVVAERAFAPWPDMEELLKREGLPLVTRETGRPLKDFDLVGFTLQYELSITNVLTMLKLGGVELLAAERGEDSPIVIGGGPVAANPEPYADFFDCFFIGEAEEGIKEIAETLAKAKEADLSRAEKLAALAKITGVYVPRYFVPQFADGRFAGFKSADGQALKPVKRRVVAGFGTLAPPKNPLLPFGETVHDRLAVEVVRGCTRGCRFCQAGYLYRPVRERSPSDLLNHIKETLKGTGHEEVGLLSLSTGDYTCVGPLTATLIDELGKDHVSVSLPSLRIDGLDPRLAAQIARVRKTGFTLAPEAGSERLRRAINKDFSDEAILETIGKIFGAGYKSVKLYFMVGLPFEEESDQASIVALSRRIAGLVPGGKGRFTVSVSNFVPKPHTPFQWAPQIDLESLKSVHDRLRREVPGKKAELKYHDSKVSLMEGVLARGDRRLGAMILSAWEKGCRMDGWSSEYKSALWDEAMEENGLTLSDFLRARDLAEPLPWDIIDNGVSRAYLESEYAKAKATVATPDCRSGECTGCGLCDFSTLMPVTAVDSLPYPEPKLEEPEETGEPEGERLRFLYSKTGAAALLSHLETSRILLRAFRAGGIDVAYSRGFNPHPKMQLGPALSLGTESLSETGEMRVASRPELKSAVDAANSHLPEGLRILALWHMGSDSRTLTGGGMEEEFLLTPSTPAREKLSALGGWEAVVALYRESGNVSVVKRRKNKPDRVLEAKDFVLGLWAEGDDLGVRLLRHTDGAILSPEALASALLDLPEDRRALDRTLKIRTLIY